MIHRCKKCQPSRDEKDLQLYINDYIESLPMDLKADAETFKKRVDVCLDCEYYTSNICGLCGCYVAIRAYKKSMTCPHPKANMWL